MSLSTTALRGWTHRVPLRLTALAVGAVVALGSVTVATPGVAQAADTTYTGIILGVGADETQRMVTWYTSADVDQVVQVVPTASLVDGQFPTTGAVRFAATGSANIATSGGFNRHATLTGLAENTSYTYRVGSADAWSGSAAFRTQSFEGDYDFLFFGDPQIGSSGNVAKDQEGWVDTVDVATAANPDAEILVSGGDQVETANTEAQWDAFLAPQQLKEIPWAATIGNHDVGGKAYEQHLATPNTDRSAAYYSNGQPTSNSSGGDYWYLYKDVLFIDLNSNSYATSQGGGGDAAHVAYVTDVIDKHGADAKYTVLVYHHSIYSAASHAQDADNGVRRTDFPATFSELGVDLVLQGHDHVYTRSYLINSGQKADADEQPGQADVFAGPGGVLYVTANSASGSKYYDITTPTAGGGTSGAATGPDPLNPDSYWFNSVQNQEHVRTYVKVQVKADKLVVENIRSGTCDAPNAAVELGKVSWCGPDSGATADQPVGSVVDSVTVHPYQGEGQEIQVAVPDAAPGEFGWTIDGYNGLVDLGTAVDNGGQFFEATGEINPITVTDTRRAASPWSISASVGEFHDAGKTFSGSALGWTPKIIEAGAGARAGRPVASGYDGGTGLSVSRALGAADQGHDTGEATLGADLDLKIPGTVDKGTYRATLTITALSS